MKTSKKYRINKLLSLLLVLIMVVNLLPITAFATNEDCVYISVSHDGKFVTDKNNTFVTYVKIPISKIETINLDDYGLSEYHYDGNNDGKNDITALHLYIYTHEKIFGLDWNDVTIEGGAGSIYLKAGLFGFEDENLTYYRNGAYPEIMPGWGATADQLTLSNGDFYDIAHYTSFSFWMDSAAGYHYFANNGEIAHSFEVEENKSLSIQLLRTYGGLGSSGGLVEENEDYEIFYGTTLETPSGTVTTDSNGYATVTFPSAGTWYLWCDGNYGSDYPEDIVSAPAYAKVIVTGNTQNPDSNGDSNNGSNNTQNPDSNNGSNNTPTPDTENTPSTQAKDISHILNTTMAQLASTVTEPTFGTNAGEWTVLSLARGEYYPISDMYFYDYYNRIVNIVNETATSVNLNGALHKSKSTDNSRLIVALSSIGKNATSVGNWNLITPYKDFNWIKNQGINGVIWALIALDTNNYQTDDATIRQQCINYLLDKELEDGGWALSGDVIDPDITSMALQALYPYKHQNNVAITAEKAFTRLSAIQDEDGGYTSWNSKNSESCSQVIVACTTWGINPDTDIRFIKNGKSVVDALLTYYVEESGAFKHVLAGDINDIATDQACYALVAYQRFIHHKTALYDMSDVRFENTTDNNSKIPSSSLNLPEKINGTEGETFNAILNLDYWDNEAGYKLIDFIVNIPNGLKVTSITSGTRLNGGEVSYHLEEESRKLRVVYFDATKNSDLTINGAQFPAEFFKINFEVTEPIDVNTLNFQITGMSFKKSSNSTETNDMTIANTTNASASVEVIQGISYSAVCLYTGDNIDLIPSAKKAVAVSVTGIEKASKLTYNDGTNKIEFKYNDSISRKSGIITYVAVVNSAIAMDKFTNTKNFTLDKKTNPSQLTFGDSNGDGVVNAQDALMAVDTWLRKVDTPSDNKILTLNVNGDSRINTFDALGIVEAFVDGSEYIIVNKAVTLTKK